MARVLIIEDHPANMKLATFLLKNAGHEVLAAVDWVVAFSEETPERLIRLLKPDLLVKGGDYRPEQIAGADFVRAQGGEVRVLDYVEACSTTAMIEKMAARQGAE